MQRTGSAPELSGDARPGGAAVQGAEQEQGARPGVLPLSSALVRSAREFLGPREKSGARPNISKGGTGRRG